MVLESSRGTKCVVNDAQMRRQDNAITCHSLHPIERVASTISEVFLRATRRHVQKHTLTFRQVRLDMIERILKARVDLRIYPAAREYVLGCKKEKETSLDTIGHCAT